MHNGGMSLKHK